MPRSNTKFVNPYTFVPLGKRLGQRDEPAEHKKLPDDDGSALTGVIHCTLQPLTPLAIPDTSEKRQKDDDEKTVEDRTYEFFKIDGRPTIPGSSLRGPIRSVFEALTDSCMRTNGDRLHSFTKAKKAGLLKKTANGYELFEATRYRIANVAIKNATSGYGIGQCETTLGLDTITETQTNRQGREFQTTSHLVTSLVGGGGTGYYMRMNELNGSKPSFFVKGQRIGELPDVEEDKENEAIGAFIENIRMYIKNAADLPGDDPEPTGAMKRADAYGEAFKNLKSGSIDMLPVWYDTTDDGLFLLSPAQISRTVFTASPNSLLGKLAHDKCASSGSPCPACSLFGYVANDNDDTHCQASRVRFSDARLREGVSGSEHYELPSRWLPVLMEPRSSSFEFYLKGNGEDFTPAKTGTDLAGRKFYWHHQHGLSRSCGDEDYNSQMELLEPKGPASEPLFEFDVYFDHVSKTELNQLVYALSLGQCWREASGQQLCHKIGHGKPVGLGSVLVKVEHVKIRPLPSKESTYTFDCIDSWKVANIEEVERTLSGQALKAIKIVTNFGEIDDEQYDIDYPRLVQKNGDIFEWFSENRNPPMKGKYQVPLPDTTDDDHTLPRNPKDGRARTNTQQNEHGGSSGSPSIKMYNADKGFGFIERGKDDDLFFHISQWHGNDEPRKGQRVTFSVDTGRNGKTRALDVRPQNESLNPEPVNDNAANAPEAESYICDGSQEEHVGNETWEAGTVSQFAESIGFGTIARQQRGGQLRFLQSDCTDGYTPSPGDSVRFIVSSDGNAEKISRA